ncbi:MULTISPECIES: bifunctional acetate--CoA ligase family protein/GNAT family N-acetyltransferase [unclassified Haematospirillum]|uniref:bifunctional acetate--CoA ligase family protein/GNAT family N-acetyltransferase n=1 Tax=unclassified Haematospirillum TaxID=2622088 RepID=UPI001438BC23|nr:MULTISPECIES: bifunctional acetate--CoA ligase family protein/GNAT family N-acetyltransferase [unclassified Haematospirillum]NKD54280.1 bifunctional acetate--CoA ligase family protein/GNAT family N-acetyltransferase [Haematospirillum sp. H4890]NKD74324.1 bifunctional acetate--CoA ligase family protein/GNAT family N-acetyltransferase [Haematospirillum sp. H4485]
MGVRHLEKLLRPSSLAVIGASHAQGSVGTVVMRNLLHGAFKGPVLPVNPKYTSVQGVLAYPDIASIPIVPDLAILAVPPEESVVALESLGQRGTKAAISVTSGLGRVSDNPALTGQLLNIALRYDIRLLGPNSLGLQVPALGLNASMAPQAAHPGKIAFVSQSGALCTAVLDWAWPRGIGFSHFISLGGMMNTGFGDILDYLGGDPDTRAILLYMESIPERRNFMSAARSAARNKPVLVIKAGRHPAVQSATVSHTGALAGNDDVYEAAIRRAGMLRVYDIEELFSATETLAIINRPKGPRLAILTNGGGIGILAVDDLLDEGGTLAELSDETLESLSKALNATWSHGNPVQIHGDSDGARYAAALGALAQAREVDGILVMHAPTCQSDPLEVAEKIVATARQNKRTSVMACWVGDDRVEKARALFHQSGIPNFQTPHQAVRAFLHMIKYRQVQDLLMETPASLPTEFTANTKMARRIISEALEAGHSTLSEPEAKALLSAYGIPVVETRVAHSPEEVRSIAEEMAGPLALKILSPDIHHKSDKGGVRLGLFGADDTETAARRMLSRIKDNFPDAEIRGFTVQRMEKRQNAHEIIIGLHVDPVFGPVILFGHGGTATEIINDHAIALPPLNMTLARDLVERTRVSRLLQGFRHQEPADMEALCLALVQVAQMAIDLPEIQWLDINPLFCNHQGVIALDAKVEIAPWRGGSLVDRLAIRPYPKELEEVYTMRTGQDVILRPIRPEDEPNHHVFVSRLDPEDIRFRFFGVIQELPRSQMARMTQIDYDREMAFIAVGYDAEGQSETLGVVRVVNDPDHEEAEFSIVVRSDLKGTGLGNALMHKMIRYCRSTEVRKMTGQILIENKRMLAFVEQLGFRRVRNVDVDVAEVELDLLETH